MLKKLLDSGDRLHQVSCSPRPPTASASARLTRIGCLVRCQISKPHPQ
jgi:hypothetical protein